MYKDNEEPVLMAQDTELMDLETARELLHQMVKDVYSQPWHTDIEDDQIVIVDARHAQNMHHWQIA